MNSLAARVGWSTLSVLLVFIVLTAWALERAFAESSRAALRERLQAQLYLVMAESEVSADAKVQLPPALSEPRLNQSDSGLYARIGAADGTMLWQSASALALTLPAPAPEPAEQFGRVVLGADNYWYASLGIQWETDQGVLPLIYSVYEQPTGFDAQLAGYRRTLWGWLAGMALLLLATLAAALAWGLRPLRTVAGELRAIEHGTQQTLQRDYPREIRRLSDNINTLLHHERSQQQRYQHALADLAHSLKTPLAILRGIDAGRDAPLLEEQVMRMDSIVQHQLQRAATTAPHAVLRPPLALTPLLQRLLAALAKVYAERQVAVELQLDERACFRGSEGDVMELLGNLLDNAYKWCRGRIRLTTAMQAESLLITVEDDGPGIGATDVARVLQRGTRLDESTPGHGIGLSMVRDIVAAYEGELRIERSDLGGAAVHIVLPHSLAAGAE